MKVHYKKILPNTLIIYSRGRKLKFSAMIQMPNPTIEDIRKMMQEAVNLFPYFEEETSHVPRTMEDKKDA